MLSSDLEPKSADLPTSSLIRAEEQSGFSNRQVDIVILVMVIVSYIPAIFNSRFYDPVWRAVFLILLGTAYGFNAVYGTRWNESRLTWVTQTVYFSLQIGFAMGLIILGIGINNQFWLLMLPICGQAFALGKWRGPIGIALLQLAFIWVIEMSLGRGTVTDRMQDALSVSIGIGSAMVFVILFTYIALREGEIREQMQALATDLREANHRLAEYASQVEELAMTKERNRLAREIHDNLGHYLTVVNVQIEAARMIMPTDQEKANDALTKAQRLTQEGLVSVRQSISALRESPLAEQSLIKGIEKLVEETRETGLHVEFGVSGEERPLSPKLTLTLYRAAQEGMTNARKYAQANLLSLTLDYTHSDSVSLSIQDDGVGTDDPSGGFGLLGLRERVNLLNGRLQINTQPDQGFHILITLPTPEAPV